MHLKTTLFSHQQRAADKLIKPTVAALFMDMGTGKSRVAIELVYLRLGRIDRVVWFCPVGLRETVETEIFKHTDLGPEAVYRFTDHTTAANVPSDALFYIVGTESMSSSNRVVVTVNQLITPKTYVIVDESDYLRGHSAVRTQRITYISERARYRLILTGTPISNGIVDLFAQMRFLSPLILGYRSFWTFANNHLEYSDKFPGLIVRAHNTEHLAAKMQPYVYQVQKADCFDLPPKLYEKRYYSMTDEQREWYEQAKDEILSGRTGGWDDKYLIFRLFNAVQQVVSGFWRRKDPRTGQMQLITFEHERLKMLQSVLNGILDDAKVIIWCKFMYSVEKIVAMLTQNYGGGAVAQFHGKNRKIRDGEIARFRSEARFLVATAASGGRGLTLNESHYATFYEYEFEYAHRVQAEERFYRYGQQMPVTCIDLICRRSIDERIMAAHANKESVADSFRRQVQRVKDDPVAMADLIKDL